MAHLYKLLCHAQDEVAISQGCDEVLDRVICDIIAARVQHLAEACGDVFGQLARLGAEGGCTLVVGHKDCRSLQHENRHDWLQSYAVPVTLQILHQNMHSDPCPGGMA